MHAVQYVSSRFVAPQSGKMSLNRWTGKGSSPPARYQLANSKRSANTGLGLAQNQHHPGVRGEKEWWRQRGSYRYCPWVHDCGDPNHSIRIRIRMYLLFRCTAWSTVPTKGRMIRPFLDRTTVDLDSSLHVESIIVSSRSTFSGLRVEST